MRVSSTPSSLALHWRAAVVIACALAGASARPALAADGDIDPAWGPGGLRSLRIGSSTAQFSAALRRPNGHIVGVGSVSSGNRSDVVIAELDSQGHPYASFGDAGTRVVTIGPASTDTANAALMDGNAVIAIGDSFGVDAAGFLARVDSAGNLDAQFGAGGVTVFRPRELAYVSFRAAARAADGRIMVAGRAALPDPNAPTQVLVARFLPSGAIDPTFGNGAGYRLIDTGTTYRNAAANSIGILADGTILIAGFVGDPGSRAAWLLMHLDQGGVPVTSFGDKGQVIEEFQQFQSSEAKVVASTANGRVIVLGDVPGGFGTWYLVRYNADGTRDDTFGTHGVAQMQPPGWQGFISGSADALVTLPDGSYAAAGSSSIDAMVVHYLGDGTVDPSFGTQGAALAVNNYPTASGIRGLVSDSAGGFVGLGGFGLFYQPDLFAIRFTSAGAIDAAFGIAGVTTIPLLNGQDVALKSVLALPNGDVVVASVQSASLARLAPNGAVDRSFGTQQGIQPLFSGNPLFLPSPSYVLLGRQGTGRIVVGFDSSFQVPSLQRRLADGSLDGTFQPPPDLNAAFGAPFDGLNNGAESFAIDAQDRILLGGLPCNSTACDVTPAFQVARLLPDGGIDASFGNGGHIDHAVGPPGSTSAVRAVALQADGKIVVAGTYQGPAGQTRLRKPAVARLLPDGQLDSSFGTGGVVLLDPLTLFGGEVVALVVMADGRIVVGGTGYGNIFSGYLAIRLLSNGAPDPAFGQDGIAFITDQSLRTVDRGGMTVDAQGRVWFAGGLDIVRLRADGTPDPFASGDRHAQRWPYATFSSNALAIQPSGRVIAVGYTSTKAASAAAGYETSGPGLHVTPTRLDFVTSHVGVATQPKMVVVEATGTGSIGVGTPELPPGFAATSDCPASLTAGQRCAIAVRFTASALGQSTTGRMIVHSDGSILDPLVGLQGRAAHVRVGFFGKAVQSAALGTRFEDFAAWVTDPDTSLPILATLHVSAPASGPSADLAWTTLGGRSLDIPTNTISPSTIAATAAGTGGSYSISIAVVDTDASITLTFTNEATDAQMRMSDGSTLAAHLVEPPPHCVIQALRESSRYTDVPPATPLRGRPFELTLGPACPPVTAVQLSVAEKAAGDIALLARQNGTRAQWDAIATGDGWRIAVNDGGAYDLDGNSGTATMALAVVVSSEALEIPALSPWLLAALGLLIGACGTWAVGRRRSA